jgi:AraC-like DNA-binding protein
MTLHLGASLGSGAEPISRAYQHALGAAESALASGRKLVVADAGTRRSPHSLRALRDELGRGLDEDPQSLPARFDRYVEAVSVHSGYRMEPARAELELFLERTADALLRSGALDPKSLSAMHEGLDRASSEAATVSDLFSAYRRAIGDMAEAIRNPVLARRDRGLRGALDYVHQHYAEPLGLEKIARVAGFAPKYFSELFRRREKITFERYVLRLRIERAKHLLTGTDLNARRVAELSGLKTPQYLCRVFRRAAGSTPLEYRAARRPEWTKKLRRRRG